MNLSLLGKAKRTYTATDRDAEYGIAEAVPPRRSSRSRHSAKHILCRPQQCAPTLSHSVSSFSFVSCHGWYYLYCSLLNTLCHVRLTQAQVSYRRSLVSRSRSRTRTMRERMSSSTANRRWNAAGPPGRCAHAPNKQHILICSARHVHCSMLTLFQKQEARGEKTFNKLYIHDQTESERIAAEERVLFFPFPP